MIPELCKKGTFLLSLSLSLSPPLSISLSLSDKFRTSPGRLRPGHKEEAGHDHGGAEGVQLLALHPRSQDGTALHENEDNRW